MKAMGGRVRVWRATANGVNVRIRLTPKSAADAVMGVGDTADGPALLVRVRAVPEKGAANLSLEKVMAGWLGVPRGCVSVTDGTRKARVKVLQIGGEPRALEALVAALIDALG
jgi:uncharacterized protein YggU (UPF0235/DUF167 family)